MKQNKKEKNSIKIVVALLCSIMLINIVLPFSNVFAASYTQTVVSGIEAFPESYQIELKKIKELHPNWTFDAYYTGIDWNVFTTNETCGVKQGRSLIIGTVDPTWKCSCGYCAAGYYCASPDIIKYYADPRNFLNDTNVFQFIEYTYNPAVHTLEGTKKSVKNTFLDSNVTYTLNGVQNTKSYAEIIFEAAQQSGMSPYSIRAKIIQEVGSKGSSSITGTVAGYENYYNFYNYGAYDGANAIEAGLTYAKNNGWNNQYTAIVEGAKLLSNSYTLAGQNTAYFYKWDVVGSSILRPGVTQTVTDSNLFGHQYMTNIQDPNSQSVSLYNMYANSGILDEKLNFVIPVYDNMPGGSKKPTSLTGSNLYYADVRDALNVRAQPSTSSAVIKTLTKDEQVIMLQRNYTTANDLSWDKIQLADGKVGFAASKYLVPLTTETGNIGVTAVTFDKSELSLQVGNGAATKSTLIRATVLPTCATNQSINWTTSNAAVATVSGGVVTAVGAGTTTITATTVEGNKQATCTVTVSNVEATPIVNAISTGADVNVRAKPTTSASSIGSLSKGQTVIMLQQNVTTADGYTWHKIQLSNGTVGYTVSTYLSVISSIKKDDGTATVKATPEVLASAIYQQFDANTYKVVNANGVDVANNDLVGTGYKVVNKSTGATAYTIVKAGDVNGDGKVKATDYMTIKNCIMGVSQLNEIQRKAGDVNGDSNIKATDYMTIKNYIMGVSCIGI